jgi:hypothetical protein
MTCSKCTNEVESRGYYCRPCRAAYMREWRQRVKARRLHRVVDNLSRVSHETPADTPEMRDVPEVAHG